MFFLNPNTEIASGLRRERKRLHLKQSEMANLLGISRFRQICYENGIIQPNLDYLRSAQRIGVDVFGIFCGDDANSGFTGATAFNDWPRLWVCAEAVEFFCARFAPSCSTSYRWKMVHQLYQAISKANDADGPESSSDHPSGPTLNNSGPAMAALEF